MGRSFQTLIAKKRPPKTINCQLMSQRYCLDFAHILRTYINVMMACSAFNYEKKSEQDVSLHDRERHRLTIRWIYLHRHTQGHIPKNRICSSSVSWAQGRMNQPNDRSGWWKSDRDRTNQRCGCDGSWHRTPSKANGSKRLDQNQRCACISEKLASW